MWRAEEGLGAASRFVGDRNKCRELLSFARRRQLRSARLLGQHGRKSTVRLQRPFLPWSAALGDGGWAEGIPNASPSGVGEIDGTVAEKGELRKLGSALPMCASDLGLRYLEGLQKCKPSSSSGHKH